MSTTTYILIWGLTALLGWIIWLFVWKFNHEEQYWSNDLIWIVGFGWLLSSLLWPVALPVLCLVGIGYLLYRWIIE